VTALHHLGYWVADLAAAAAAASRALGVGPFLVHRTATAGAVEVAWYHGGSLFPHPVEVHRAGPPILGMPGRLAALAEGWAGEDLLRPL
jgi:hypothetical protein